jgi:hypothetical protein
VCFLSQKFLTLVRKQLATKSWLASGRYLLWFVRALSDQRQTAFIAEKLGFRLLDIPKFRFSDEKVSDTIFILGSGKSVSELSEDHFAEIAEHVSVGINLWVAHPFVPDSYSFEAGGFPPSDLDLFQMRQMGRELARGDVLNRKPKIVLLRPSAPSRHCQFVPIPDALNSLTFLYGRSNVPELELGIVKRGIRDFLRRYLGSSAPRHALPDNGASVVRMIFLALSLGYKKIVLVGVDLNRSPYFWYCDEWVRRRPDLKSIFPRPLGKRHDTTEIGKRPHDTRELIVWMSQAVQEISEAQILVASSSSSLAKELPVYSWAAGD